MIEEQVALWKSHQERVKLATAAKAEAYEALRAFMTNHLREHPLAEHTRESLRATVHADKPLCCEAGKAFLDTIVDPIWAESINAWAYEALGCRAGARYREEFLRKLNQFMSEPRWVE